MIRLLVVDDEPFFFALIEASLAAEGHTLVHAADARSGLAALRAGPFDLVLLDIELPDGDGYGFCRELRGDEALSALPVLFVSGHGSVAERLAAYDAGGDDFIVKPFDADEFRRKVAVALKNQRVQESLRGQAGEAMQIAMSAMSDSGAMGTILGFVREAFHLSRLDELAAALVRVLGQYGIEVAVRLEAEGQPPVTSNSSGRSSPMEGVLLAGLAEASERIAAIDKRLLVSYPHVVILVKRMPVEDEARCGRIRDYLALIAEIASERVAAIIGELLLRTIVGQVRAGIDAIDVAHRRQHEQTMAVMDRLSQELERTVPHLGLTTVQENRLFDLVQSAGLALNVLSEESLGIDQAFAGLRQLLSGTESRRSIDAAAPGGICGSNSGSHPAAAGFRS